MDRNPGLVAGLERRYVDVKDAGLANRPVVLEGLAAYWPSDYWASLAIAWLEDGFPMDEDIAGLLEKGTKSQAWTQRVRHRAFALCVQWRRSQCV